MENSCNILSNKPNQTNSLIRLVKFNELEFKISIYEKELINLHETFERQSQFALNSYLNISNNENTLIEIEDKMKIHQEAVNEVEILLCLIENDLNSVELKLNQILYKLGNDSECINVPVTVRGNIYLSLFTVSGCMNQIYDEIIEFHKQSNAFVNCNNITSHILFIHVSLALCLEKNIAKLLEMVNAIDEMCPLIVM